MKTEGRARVGGGVFWWKGSGAAGEQELASSWRRAWRVWGTECWSGGHGRRGQKGQGSLLGEGLVGLERNLACSPRWESVVKLCTEHCEDSS